MMFMRATAKAQKDKGNDLAVSLDSIKAALADERLLSQRLQQQLHEAEAELHERALEFDLSNAGAAAQLLQQERTELQQLRICNNELLGEVRAQQQALKAKDFMLAAQKAAAAAAADKAAAAVQDVKKQLAAAVAASNEAQFSAARAEDVFEVQKRDIAVAQGRVAELQQAVEEGERLAVAKQHAIDALETQVEKQFAQIQSLELKVQTQSRAIETRH